MTVNYFITLQSLACFKGLDTVIAKTALSQNFVFSFCTMVMVKQVAYKKYQSLEADPSWVFHF
jgi:hypothetical protein